MSPVVTVAHIRAGQGLSKLRKSKRAQPFFRDRISSWVKPEGETPAQRPFNAACLAMFETCPGWGCLPSTLLLSFRMGMSALCLSDHCILGIHSMFDFKGPELRATCHKINHVQSHVHIWFMWYSDETSELKMVSFKTFKVVEINRIYFVHKRTWILVV